MVTHNLIFAYFYRIYGNSSLVMWQSKKICCVVKSTMAAETLALVDVAEASCWL